MPGETFDSHVPAFDDYQSSPWGRLLHKLSTANVERHIAQYGGRALRILDAGVGSGVEGIAFALQGHAVTILDSSALLLSQARQNALEAGVLDRMAFHEAELLSIPGLFSRGSFDVILCHNVLQYVDDLRAALAALRHPLASGGLISVVCINRYSEVYRLALQQLQPGSALGKLNTKTIFSSVFKVDVQAYTAEEMSRVLEQAGCTLLAQYGLRCLFDYIPNNELKSEPAFFAELEQLEYALSAVYPYYLMARFFQVIGTAADDQHD